MTDLESEKLLLLRPDVVEVHAVEMAKEVQRGAGREAARSG